MKNTFKMLLAFFFLLTIVGCSTAQSTKNGPKENNDPENNEIISTTVAVTEILDALEIDLIGVPTSYKKLPSRYDGVPEVGNPMGPDMELIMSLQPKEVVSVTTLKSDLIETFDDNSLNATYVDLESVDKMYEEVSRIANQYNREEQGEQIVQEFDEKMLEIEEKVTDKEAPRVLVLMGVPGSYLVATDKSYIGNLVTRSGGKNVFSGEEVEFLSSNTEHLQQTNPDIVLRAAHGMPAEVVDMFDEEFKENDIWKHFKAVENGRVYDLEETLFGTTGNLAAPEALDELFTMLYPDN